MTAQSAVPTMTSEQILAEARRRVLDHVETLRARGDAALAAEMRDVADDLGQDEYLPERDLADVHAFAALMGVTVSDRR